MKTLLSLIAVTIACLHHSPLATTATGATLTIGVTGPQYQVLVPGSLQGTFLTITLTASPEEDVRMDSLPLRLSVTNGATPSSLSNLHLLDGSTRLNTGANTLNVTDAGTNTITFDYSLIVPKGVTKTLMLKGYTSSAATGAYRWSVGGNMVVTGITSSQPANTAIENAGVTTALYGSRDSSLRFSSFASQPGGNAAMYYGVIRGEPFHPLAVYASEDLNSWSRITGHTFSETGQINFWDIPDGPKRFYKAVSEWPNRLIVSTSPTSPRYTIASGGTTNVTMGMYTFRANYEAVNLNRIGLRLTQGSASDLGQVSVWEGTNRIGSTFFVGGNVYAVCAFVNPLLIPKDAERVLTIKADLEPVVTFGGVPAMSASGHFVAIDYDDSNLQRTAGTGVESGQTITATGKTAVSGVRIFKSYPSFAIDQLPGTGVGDGRLLRFKVTADAAGSVSLYKLSFFIEANNASVWNVNLYAYEDLGYSVPVSGVSAGGKVSVSDSFASLVEIRAQTPTGAPSAIVIPAGQTRYFELRGSVPNLTGATVTYARLLSEDYGAEGKILWSPDTLGPVQPGTSHDWTNGYGLPGLTPSIIVQARTP